MKYLNSNSRNSNFYRIPLLMFWQTLTNMTIPRLFLKIYIGYLYTIELNIKLCFSPGKDWTIWHHLTLLIFSLHAPTCRLRSSDKFLLTVPQTKSSIGDRAFCAVAPKLWNSLPADLRQSTSLHHFKSGLKTFYSKLPMSVKMDRFHRI